MTEHLGGPLDKLRERQCRYERLLPGTTASTYGGLVAR